MATDKLALFVSGIFFGGSIDHVVLAVMNSALSPLGLEVGALGNWLFGILDAVIAVCLYVVHLKLQ
jgi:hypothetical protein